MWRRYLVSILVGFYFLLATVNNQLLWQGFYVEPLISFTNLAQYLSLGIFSAFGIHTGAAITNYFLGSMIFVALVFLLNYLIVKHTAKHK